MISSGSSSKSSSNFLAPISAKRMEKFFSSSDHIEVENSSRTSKLLGRKASIRLKIQARGPICKSRRKIDSSGLQSEGKDEDGDLDKKFEEEIRSDDVDDASSWLSRGISSPSCCFDDEIFRSFLDFTLDDWLVSLLISSTKVSPRFSRTTTFFDGSRMNPLEESISVLQKSSYEEENFQEYSLSEEEITAWLMNSVEVEDEDCLCCRRRNFELSRNWELQKMGFFGSLIDLDAENSEWISDANMNFLQIDVPSPSFKSSWSIESQSSISSSDVFSLTESEQKEIELISSTAALAEEDKYNELTDYRGDDPLFWPCDMNFDWGSEFSWDFLVMSPRKNTHKPGRSKGNLRERIKLAIHRAKIVLKGEDKKVWLRSTSATTDIIQK